MFYEWSALEHKDNINNCKIITVEYPGMVKDEEKMIKTLGGIPEISTVFCSDKKRLELRFRPENKFCKPAHGDRTTRTGIIFKIKYRRLKNPSGDPKQEIKSVNMVGFSSEMYQFNNLCDFQYLPIRENPTTKVTEFIHKKIVPEGVLKPDWLTEKTNVPYFLPPVSFSRIDTVQNNIFKKEPGDANIDNSIIGVTRVRRSTQAKYVNFDLVEPVPQKPNKMALELMKVKMITQDKYELIQKLFQKRPIWTKNAIQYESKIDMELLKILLPTVSFYYTTGPWRVCWVRFGYDPRQPQNFYSRFYQILDYRVRAAGGIKAEVKIKRVNKPYTKVYKSVNDGEDTVVKKKVTDHTPIFEIGTIPSFRISFYQYLDVHIPKIQEMLEKSPTPMSGAICNEKRGWLPPGFDDRSRDILANIVKENFQNELFRKDQDEDYDDIDETVEDEDEFEYDESYMGENESDDETTINQSNFDDEDNMDTS